MYHIPLTFSHIRSRYIFRHTFCLGGKKQKRVIMTNNKTFNNFIYRNNKYNTKKSQKQTYKQKKKTLNVVFYPFITSKQRSKLKHTFSAHSAPAGDTVPASFTNTQLCTDEHPLQQHQQLLQPEKSKCVFVCIHTHKCIRQHVSAIVRLSNEHTHCVVVSL